MIALFTRTSQPNTAQLASRLDAAQRELNNAQAEADRANVKLQHANAKVEELKAALNQHLNPGTPNRTNPNPPITQSNPSPTQAAGVLHKQPMQPGTTNRPTQTNPPQHAISNSGTTRTVIRDPGSLATVGSKPVTNNAPSHKSVVVPAPPQHNSNGLSTKHAPEVPANKVTPIRGMETMLSNRVQYHTDAVCIVSVKDEGLLKMYGHYVSGDGVSSGVPTPEGYEVELRVSKTGKQYRLVHVPALQITCTLEQPLPTDFIQCKEALREWLKANEYLKGVDSNKKQFTIDYDFYNQEYSPYVSVDGKGTTLYVYIGTESLTSTSPAPTLIA